MCGIVGIVPKTYNGFFPKDFDIFREMLYCNVLRGGDATGLIGSTSDGDFGIMKRAASSDYFVWDFENCDLKKALLSRGRALIGHNRAKTVGANASENAHPFVIDKTFAMVHNGTLRNHHKLAETTVDSEALATVLKQAMDKEDWKTALEETLGRVEGAYAVVWYDQKRNEMCMVRNSQRPLWLVECDQGVMFASEPGLPSWIGGRHGVRNIKFVEVPVDTLIKFDLKKGGASYDQIPLTLRSPKATAASTATSAPTTTGTTLTIVETTKSTLDRIFKKSSKPEPVSKNMYKHLRKKLMNKQLCFRVDDYVEQSFPKNNGKWILLGESVNGAHDICELRHVVKGIADLEALKVTTRDIDGSLCDWYGTITAMSYTPKFQSMEISLSDIKPVRLSNVSNDTVVH